MTRRRTKGARRWIRYHAARASVRALTHAPRDATLAGFAALSDVTFALMPRQRRLVRRQIDIAFPGASPAWKRALARAAFRSMSRAAVETFRLPVDSVERWRERVIYEGVHHLERCLERRRGVIVASAHFGAWEILPSLVAMLGHPVTVVVRSVREQRLDRLIANARRAHGVRLVDRAASPHTFRRVLRENGVLMMAADHRPRTGRRTAGTFLDHPAWISAGPATLSLAFDAPLMSGRVMWMERNRHVVIMESPLVAEPSPVLRDRRHREAAVAALTTRLSMRIERWIRANPEQWVWFHERWKDVPSPSPIRDDRMDHRGERVARL